MVPQCAETMHSKTADFNTKEFNQPSPQNCRLEIMRQSKAFEQLSEEAKDILEKRERVRTTKTYQSAWKSFCNWCSERGKNSSEYSLPNAINYLTELSTKTPKSVKTHRTAISSTWKILHPDCELLGENQIIKCLIQGFNEKFPRKPISKNECWNPILLLQACAKVDNNTTSLRDLSMKTATLLALATHWRPKSDLERIKLEDVEIYGEYMYLTATQPKEGDFKRIKIHKINNIKICPIQCIIAYINATNNLRNDETKNLFISSKKPYGNAKSDTIGNWIKGMMQKANITANVHSTRSVSSSAAINSGIKEDIILKKGNWKNKNTFLRHYYRPTFKEPNIRVHFVNSKVTLLPEPASCSC